MREALLDTDILSELMEGKDVRLAEIARQYYRVFRRYTISAATVLEVRAGLVHQPSQKDIVGFAAIEPMLEVMSIGKEEADLAGQIIGNLRRLGLTIGHMDPMIAATSIENDFVLVTGNIRHYQRIVDAGYSLSIENWRSL